MTLTQQTRALQKALAKKGFDPGPIDGIWGPRTAAAALLSVAGEKPEPAALPTPVGNQFDARTERNLATLQPGAQKTMRPFVSRAISVAAAMGVELKVICGDRNRADQEAAKRSGASKAGYGYSWHNYGMAIDFGCFKGRSYLDSDDAALANKVYRAIGSIAPDFGIEWGGSWRTFKDYPHFHVDLGRSTPNSSDRKKLKAGTWSYT